jgi:hypothetical protein
MSTEADTPEAQPAAPRRGRPKGTIPPNAGKGRKPGSKNKISRDVGEAVLRALEKAGGDEYLLRLAEKEPRTFGSLLAKLMPTRLTGGDGGAIKTENTTLVAVEVYETIRQLGERVRTVGLPAPLAEPEQLPVQH